MATRRLASLSSLVLGLATSGCFGASSFVCERDDQCSAANASGICEPTGFCSFLDADCPSGRRYGDASGPNAGVCVGATEDAGIGTEMPGEAAAVAFCDLAEPTLVGCWQFDSNLADGSPFANNGTGTGTISYVAGRVGLAVALDATSHIAVADSASLTKPAISIEAWLNPMVLPANRFGILDNNNSYGVFLNAGGEVRCTVSVSVNVPAAVVAGQWTHVACTYDGTTGRVYVNGALRAMAGGGAPLGAGDAAGTALGGNSPTGDPFVGFIDQVRVFDVARTPAQICEAAGGAGC